MGRALRNVSLVLACLFAGGVVLGLIAWIWLERLAKGEWKDWTPREPEPYEPPPGGYGYGLGSDLEQIGLGLHTRGLRHTATNDGQR